MALQKYKLDLVFIVLKPFLQIIMFDILILFNYKILAIHYSPHIIFQTHHCLPFIFGTQSQITQNLLIRISILIRQHFQKNYPQNQGSPTFYNKWSTLKMLSIWWITTIYLGGYLYYLCFYIRHNNKLYI